MNVTPNQLVREMIASGMRQEELAEKLKVSQSSVNRYLNSDTEPKLAVAQRIANLYAAIKSSSSTVTAEAKAADKPPAFTLPVLGYVGAGARVYPVDGGSGDEVLDEVELDFPMPPNTGTAIVRGDSMLPVFEDGDLVGYLRGNVDEGSIINRLCIVKTTEGPIYLKTVRRGSVDGLYTLTSFNASDIEDVAIEWAAPFQFRVSRSSWRQASR